MQYSDLETCEWTITTTKTTATTKRRDEEKKRRTIDDEVVVVVVVIVVVKEEETKEDDYDEHEHGSLPIRINCRTITSSIVINECYVYINIYIYI